MPESTAFLARACLAEYSRAGFRRSALERCFYPDPTSLLYRERVPASVGYCPFARKNIHDNSHPARRRLPADNGMQESSREAHWSRHRRHLHRPNPLTFLKLGRYHGITRRPAALYGCRHDLVGRLFECIPNVDPDTRPRKDGTASRFGARYRSEQPATDTDDGEESQGDASYVRFWTIRR